MPKKILKKFQYIKLFKDKMVDFLDELIEQLPGEPVFLLLRIFVNDKIPVNDVLGRFMKDCLKYKDYVQNRNDLLFTQGDFLYSSYAEEFGREYLDQFKTFWLDEKYLSKQSKEVVWQWFDLFYKLSMDYYTNYGPVEEWEFDLEEEMKKLEEETKNK